MRDPRFLVVFSVLGCAPAETHAGATWRPAVEAVSMPVSSPQRGVSAARQNAECEGCHSEIARQWRASLHHGSYSEPQFQRALSIEPLAFCRSCHAPEADPERDAPAPLAELGVGCVTCHVSEGRILAAPGARSAVPPPHEVVRDARFASAAACANCHQFAFPDGTLRDRPLLMQSTLSEHAQSPLAAVACASCHMPRVDGHRSHSFWTSRNPAMLKRALGVSATRVDGEHVRIELRPLSVGHAVPTGDLFRRLQVSAEVLAPEAASPARSERFLTRHFVIARRNSTPFRDLASDDRVGLGTGGPTLVELDLGATAAGHAIRWRVAYQRVQQPQTIDSNDALLDGEIEIGSGILQPLD